MTTLDVLLYFKRRWDNYNKYIDYNTYVVVISSDSTFETLISIIATELNIDTYIKKKKIDSKYTITDFTLPIEIRYEG